MISDQLTYLEFAPLQSVLFDSSSEDNIVHPIFAKELGLSIRPLNGKVQKVDGIILDTYEIVVVAFLVMDKTN